MSKVQRILYNNLAPPDNTPDYDTIGTDEETLAWEVVRLHEMLQQLNDRVAQLEHKMKGGD